MTEDKRSESDQYSTTSRTSRSELLGEALGLYVQKTRSENEESRSWIRQPNNFISAVAIVLSLVSLGYGLLKDHFDGIDKNLQYLSTVVEDLTKLDSDILTAKLNDPQGLAAFGIVLNNRRVALLAEADRLITDLGNRVPVAQLAVLGPEYVQLEEYTKAIQYFSLTAERASSTTLRSSAWRSMAVTYEDMGLGYDQNVRDAFQRAAQILSSLKDIGSITQLATIYEQWALFEASRANYTDALSHFTDARRVAMQLPCDAPRTDFIVGLSQDVAKAIPASHRIEASRAAQVATLAATEVCP